MFWNKKAPLPPFQFKAHFNKLITLKIVIQVLLLLFFANKASNHVSTSKKAMVGQHIFWWNKSANDYPCHPTTHAQPCPIPDLGHSLYQWEIVH